MTSLTVCLGPSALSRCPNGTLTARTRCGPCTAVWRLSHPTREVSAAEAAEHRAILAAWQEVNGWHCPGHPDTDHQPHRVAAGQLTVHHLQDVVAGGAPVGGPKQVLCRYWNSRLGAQLGNALRAESRDA